MTLGLLPASGSASRIGGLPKFMLPVEDNFSILQWHVSLMNEACDSVRVSTRECWMPLVTPLNLGADIYVKEPSTMSDAVLEMSRDRNDAVIVGMPDVYIHNSKNNFYKDMLESDGDIVLATWDYRHETMRGKVGQVLVDSFSNVLQVVDKDPNCEFNQMWGAILFRNGLERIDVDGGSVLKDLNKWIADGVSVKAVTMSGEYIDSGTFEGLTYLYSKIQEKNESA
jgi:hypothetical protein